MGQKLGHYLIDRGCISTRDLENALTAQVIFGGRLGTLLVEFGAISEEKLQANLSEKFNVPAVDPSALEKIPKEIIHIIPVELALKVSAIPLRLDGRRLTVAMLDPADLKAIDELSFFTSKAIRPVVIPEMRFVQALEKYYGIHKEQRFLSVTLHGKEEKKRLENPPAPKEPSSLVEGFDVPFEPVDFTTLPGESLPFPEMAITETVQPETVQPEATENAPIEFNKEFLVRHLATAQNRNDVAELLMAYLGHQFSAAALFTIRNSTAKGWRGVRGRKPVQALVDLEISLTEPSILHTVFQSKRNYLGPVPKNAINSRIFEALGESPDFALLIPLNMLGRLIGVLLISGEVTQLQSRILDLNRTTEKAVMALEILILRNKILLL